MSQRFCFFAILLAGCAPMAAQIATTASLVGTVTDPSGTAVSGAKVTGVEKGTADTATTNDQGYYLIEFVRVGAYNVTTERDGVQ